VLGSRKGLTVVVSRAGLILGLAEGGRSREVAGGDPGWKLDEHVIKLGMQGELNKNDRLNEHLGGVPQNKVDITLHHLLTHTAGVLFLPATTIQ
jgi:hypothetical protein